MKMADIFDLFRRIEKKKTESLGVPEYIVAGLGNPGREYLTTRHNAGFMSLDYVCKKYGAVCETLKFHSLTGVCRIGEKKVLLMKPQTFMNNSGIAIKEACDFYKIPPEKVIVIYDDINFEPGHMRIREKGSDGGHNGMKSIIYHLSADTFPRIRIGVGKKPHPEYDLADWVLGKLDGENLENAKKCFENVPDCVELMLEGKLQDAMGRYNK